MSVVDLFQYTSGGNDGHASIFLMKKRQYSHLKIYKLLVKKNLYQ